MTKIKFCGLTRRCDIEAVNKLNPDYIGFIFSKKSSRYVSKEKAQELKRLLNPSIKAVGVFVNEKIETICSYDHVIDVIQLHGNESENYIKELKAVTKKQIIKAFRIDNREDTVIINSTCADFALLDSESGGTGKVFNWGLIEDMKKPYFLAGGLNSENVSAALATLSPYAVDVSTGIEVNGFKAEDKMVRFIEAVRRGEKQ